jgi:mycothiol synthase
VRERFETIDRLDAEKRDEVDALIRAATAVDGVPPVGEHKYLKLHAGSAMCRAILAYRDADLVGYGQLLHCDGQTTAEIVVHPNTRRRGVGSRLVAEARALAVEHGAGELCIWAYGALPAAVAIAERQHLAPSRTLLQLERPLARLPDPVPLEGYTLRAFEPGRDRDAWLELHNQVFADHPENGKWSAADLEARLGQPWFDADDFLIAEADGEMVGFNWLKRMPESGEGEIYIVGVAASQRGRGLGRALALRGLEHLRARGMRVCTLYVESDNEPGLGLYRSLGFTVRHTHHCYALSLAESDDRAVRPLPAPSASTAAARA